MARGTAGKRPDRKGGGGGGSSKWLPTYKLEEETDNGKRWLQPFWVKREANDVPIMVLDQGTESGKDDKGKTIFKLDYYVRLHFMFTYDDNFKNVVVCPANHDPRGCPICDGGNCDKDSQFFGVGTILNRTEFQRKAREGEKGDKDGKITVKSQRQLLIIPEQKIDEIDGLMTKVKGGRGACFDISRGESQTSSRIGTTWFPTGKMTEQEMVEEFADDAAAYGMTPEQYVEPADYEEVLKILSYADLTTIAEALYAEKHGTKAAAEAATQAATQEDLADEDAVPF